MTDLHLLAGKVCPKAAGKAAYLSGFYALKIFLLRKHPEVKVSVRNSILTSAFYPLLSDLDISVVFPDHYSREKIIDTLQTIQKCRAFFPVLGELNCYSENEIKKYREFMNPLEGKRDPILRTYVGEPQWGHKLGFLVRMIEADFKNLQLRPHLRKEKWRLHLKECGIPLPKPFDLNQLVCTVMQFFFKDGGLSYANSLMSYLTHLAAGKSLHDLEVSPILWALYPHRFCIQDRSHLKMNAELTKVQEFQLHWEIWGLMGQWRNYILKDEKVRMSFHQHATNLTTAFPHFTFLNELKTFGALI